MSRFFFFFNYHMDMLDSPTHLFSLLRYSWSLKITQTFFLLRTVSWLFLVYRWLNFKVLLLCTDDALLAQNLTCFCALQAFIG